MIYWKVSACESGKSCLTTDFTRVQICDGLCENESHGGEQLF